MRWNASSNGHEAEIIEVSGMGEGVESIMIWCHTCDKRGQAAIEFDMREYPKYRLAFRAATETINRHVNKYRVEA